MNTKFKVHVPSIFFVTVIFYLYWALWKEFSPTELLYNAGVFFLFAYTFLVLIKDKWELALWQEVIFMSLWCVCMFLAYNNSTYSFFQKTVSLFGMSMDSHARIMVYFFLSVIPGIILSACYKLQNEKILKIIIFIIVITSLYFSVKAVIVFPDALRARATAEARGHESILYGTPTYSIVYSFCLLVPWFMAKFSNSIGSNRIFYGSMCAGICIIVAISQFATALLALLLGVVSYWLLCNKKAEGYIFRVLVIIFVVLIVFAKTPLVAFLNSISEMVSGAWSEKLKDIAVFFAGEGAGGDLATRSNLYSDSWQSFIQSPIFGKLLGAETGDVGGHSTALDILGMVGVFGISFFLASLYVSYKRLKSLARNSYEKAAINAVMLSYLFLVFTKNIITALCVNYSFFAVIPILFNIRENKDR